MAVGYWRGKRRQPRQVRRHLYPRMEVPFLPRADATAAGRRKACAMASSTPFPVPPGVSTADDSPIKMRAKNALRAVTVAVLATASLASTGFTAQAATDHLVSNRNTVAMEASLDAGQDYCGDLLQSPCQFPRASCNPPYRVANFGPYGMRCWY